jgi:PAS domain S-box-containing protein
MIEFDENAFKKIFPFYLKIGSDMNIIDAGDSIKKIIKSLVGRDFKEVFKFLRPAFSNKQEFDWFKENTDLVIIVEAIENPLKTRFRGQFVYLKETNEVLYLNSPWFTNITDLGFHDLLITDFAIHDVTIDNLHILQSKKIVNEDMKIIADELITQRDELLKKNDLITNLSRFPDQNPQPILSLDMKGNIIYSNKPANHLMNNYGLLNESFWKTISDEFIDNGYTIYEKEFEIGEIVLHATLVPFKEKEYFNVYLRNITETVRYQNELLNTTSNLYSLINNMDSALISENNERKIVLVNKIFCDLFNIPLDPDSMVGLDCSKSANETKHLFQNEVEFIEEIEKILKDKLPVYGDILKMKNGKILERDFIPVFEKDQYLGHIWKYQDITKILQSKESLRKVEDKYKRIIENLHFGMIEVDLDENITKVYPAFCELTEYSEDELLGNNARDLLAFDDEKSQIEEQNNLRKEGFSGVYDARIKTRKGDIKNLIISGAPIFDDSQVVIGSLGIHLDISDRIKMEEELLLANNKANSSLKAKEMFLANMSHEIRTPMNVIIGMSELMEDSNLNDNQYKYLSSIKKSADNLLDLINDILDFSKIEAGHLAIIEEVFSLPDLIQNLETSFALKAKQKELSLLVEVDPLIGASHKSDALKLNQVLVNLLSNAIKFTQNGTVKIAIDLLEDNILQQKIKFSIEDEGIGISDENISEIFKIFKQEDSSITRRFGGTGLGLSISKSIVEKMGGEIQVKSEKGVGSIFYFELILKKGEDINANISIEKRSHTRTITNCRILVAEDNKMNQLLITEILRKSNCDFELVVNGQEVIDKMKEDHFDIILMDIQMPVIDGVTAAKYIREELKSSIPIIALTANASLEDQKVYREIGMNDYLLKPFKKDLLFEKIANNLDLEIDKVKNENSTSAKSYESYSIEIIEKISSGDPEFISSITKTFIEHSPKYLSEIDYGITHNQIDKVKFSSHQLKPSIDIFKIVGGKELISEIETECIQTIPDFNKLKKLYDQLFYVLTIVIKEMNSHL